jgi:nicotinate-nucleotide adenylyltransferase
MTAPQPVRRKEAILGGTFDPIHNGHLRLALELQQTLQLDRMSLMPCHRPVHRDNPGAPAAMRAEMVRLAIANCPQLTLDERELQKNRPSYTFDTLYDIRADIGPEVSLSWVVGMDAFVQLSSWYRWRELLELAHLMVIGRPGYALPEQGAEAEFLQAHQAPLAMLNTAPHGAIVLPALSMLDISATAIRQQLAQGLSPRYLLPDNICDYLVDNRWYR